MQLIEQDMQPPRPIDEREKNRARFRASRCVDEAFRRLGEEQAGPALLGPYRHYDQRGLGLVGLGEFVEASLRANISSAPRSCAASPSTSSPRATATTS